MLHLCYICVIQVLMLPSCNIYVVSWNSCPPGYEKKKLQHYSCFLFYQRKPGQIMLACPKCKKEHNKKILCRLSINTKLQSAVTSNMMGLSDAPDLQYPSELRLLHTIHCGELNKQYIQDQFFILYTCFGLSDSTCQGKVYLKTTQR